MSRVKFPLAVMAGLLAWSTQVPAQAPSKIDKSGRAADSLGSITPGGVVSGYGNYWFPTFYPFPTVGGSGYINYGPGGGLGAYYGVPATPDMATPPAKNEVGGFAGGVRPRVETAPKPRSGSGAKPKPKPKPKPTAAPAVAPAPRKPR